MFALILDSLGSTELLFILVIALIFFGPRKLPQLARQMGKGLAEFRKASDDFKRTWEREVAMETSRVEGDNNSIMPPETSLHDESQHTNGALVEPANPDLVVSRQDSHKEASEASTSTTNSPQDAPAEPLRKHDWL